MRKKLLLKACLLNLFFLFLFTGTLMAQQFKVTGTVKDSRTGDPLIGASVGVKGTTTGTVTDIDGKYSLSISSSTVILTFSYIGYTPQDVPVNGQSQINVNLAPIAIEMDQVVVIGYGTQKKSDLTGSISVVNTKEMSRVATNDVSKALQGKVAGLSVQSGGEPGAIPLVKIRGISSFNNTSPLYVIDGVMTPVNDYPMSDIESMQVLKDASAAAIYGSRAANGVIIITTKRGQSGKLKINYNGYVGMQNIVNRYNVCTTPEYQKLVNTATYNAAMTYPAYSGLLKDTLPFNNPKDPRFSTTNTDWQKECMKTGMITDHSISLSGGNEKSTFNTSFNYFDQTGTMVGNGPNYKRYSITVSSDHNYGKFKFGETMNYTYVDQDLQTFLKDNTSVSFMVEAAPTIPVYDATTVDGYGASNKVLDGSYTANVVGMNNMIVTNSKRYKFFGNVYGEYAFASFLKYKLSLTFDRTDFKDYNWHPIHNLGWAYINDKAFLHNNRSAASTANIEQTLTFDKKFGDHYLNLMVGTSTLDYNYNYVNAYAEGFAQPYFKQISKGSTTSATDYQSESRLISYFGRLIYNYKDKYLVTGSIRRDGSSRFAPSNLWGNFPSVAVGWKINNEEFLKDVKSINLLKLRASWGKLGNQEIGDYRYSAVINPYASYVFGGVLNPGSAQISYVDPAIKWESKATSNIGLDAEILNNRLSFSAEYYYWLGPTVNYADVENKGLEFTGGWRDQVGDFNYSINGNISTLNNKVLKLGAANNPVYGIISKTDVGTSVGELYGYVIDGIFQNQSEIDAVNANAVAKQGAGAVYQTNVTSPGDYRFKDLNGDGIVNDKDRSSLGSAIPNLYFGLSLSASYKLLDFAVSGNGSSGNKIFNQIQASLESGAGADQYSTRMLDAWSSTNTGTDIPRVVMGDPNGNTRNSSRWLENGNFFKITNVEIGFTLPSELLKKAKINTLRVYAKAQNLYTFTKYTGFDPDFGSNTTGSRSLFDRAVDQASYPVKAFNDYGGGLPNPRTFLIGVQLGL
jgi:TonB-dependent starch-binding outer membrane protein SusC